jgi:tetratricopeptide (TPR) repeat protein
MGRFDKAIAESKRTQELDPLSLISKAHLAFIYFLTANTTWRSRCKKIELDPAFFVARRYAGPAYQQKGQYDEAIAEFQRPLVSRTPP